MAENFPLFDILCFHWHFQFSFSMEDKKNVHLLQIENHFLSDELFLVKLEWWFVNRQNFSKKLKAKFWQKINLDLKLMNLGLLRFVYLHKFFHKAQNFFQKTKNCWTMCLLSNCFFLENWKIVKSCFPKFSLLKTRALISWI